jgi:large subunit ribosomal protein L18
MNDKQKNKVAKTNLRKQRTRRKIEGKASLLRLSIFRSAKHFHAQIIDDNKGVTLCASSDKDVTEKGKKPIEVASEVGLSIAKKAAENKIEKVVFDRGAYKYHGRVKAAAEGARKGGLKF